MGDGFDRREFLFGTFGALLGLNLHCSGCRRSSGGGGAGTLASHPGPIDFPMIEVTGTPYETGKAIGKRFGDKVKMGLHRRNEWFTEIRTFMEQDLENRYEPFLAAGKKHHPEIVEELSGWADGSGVPFKDLMALNLKNELSTLMRKRPRETPGCSTVVLATDDRLLIAHNEDGDKAYEDLMFLVKVRQPGKPAFLCLNYPGILSGNGPVMNDAGMVVTTNFISSRAVRLGVPRYFISRAAIQARSSDELVSIVTHPERAYAFHFNVGSRAEGKVLSVETSTEKHEVQTVDGLYVHTNHLVLPGMKEIEQDEKYVGTSSMSRYRVLTRMAKRHRKRLEDVGWRKLVQMLSSHQGKPYSPCRHPVEGVAEPVSGSTLGTTVFDIRAGSLRLFHGNPCGNRQRVTTPF